MYPTLRNRRKGPVQQLVPLDFKGVAVKNVLTRDLSPSPSSSSIPLLHAERRIGYQNVEHAPSRDFLSAIPKSKKSYLSLSASAVSLSTPAPTSLPPVKSASPFSPSLSTRGTCFASAGMPFSMNASEQPEETGKSSDEVAEEVASLCRANSTPSPLSPALGYLQDAASSSAKIDEFFTHDRTGNSAEALPQKEDTAEQGSSIPSPSKAAVKSFEKQKLMSERLLRTPCKLQFVASRTRMPDNHFDFWKSFLITTDTPPSSRQKAAFIDRWISTALEKYARHIERNTDLADIVGEIVPILSRGMREIVHQVTYQCVETGVVLEKLWRTYAELFDRVIHDTKQSLCHHNRKISEVELELRQCQEVLEEFRERHPQQMQMLINTFKSKFEHRNQILEEQMWLKNREHIAVTHKLKQLQQEVNLLFPMLPAYRSIRTSATLEENREVSTISQVASPEAALTQDIRRLLSALKPAHRSAAIKNFVDLEKFPDDPLVSANSKGAKEFDELELLRLRLQVSQLKGEKEALSQQIEQLRQNQKILNVKAPL